MNSLRGVRRSWRGLPTGIRVAIAVVSGLIALNLAALIADAADRSGPQGPPSSVTSTGPDGLAAYESLLQRFGNPTERLDGDLSDGGLDPGATLVVLQPDALSQEQVDSLREFAQSGGRLVIGGAELSPEELVVDDPPAAAPLPADPVLPPGFAGEGVSSDATRVRTAGLGSWRSDDAPPGTGELIVTRSTGSGEVLLLADPSAVQNEYLGDADNAGFALALAGGPGRAVQFAEGLRGSGRGLAAIPGSWRLALGLLALAALLWLAAAVRRVGAPDGGGLQPSPPRGEYVDALGSLLSRSGGERELTEAIRAAASREITRRSGRAPSRSEELAAAAVAGGASEADAAMLATGASDRDGMVAAARALAAVGDDPAEEGG